jgi:hypothetical protein
MKPGPKKGSSQSKSHVAKRAKAVKGKANGMFKDGRRSYRSIAGARNSDGKVVHHKDGDRTNNSRSNLKVLNDGPSRPGRKTTSKHERLTRRK